MYRNPVITLDFMWGAYMRGLEVHVSGFGVFSLGKFHLQGALSTSRSCGAFL